MSSLLVGDMAPPFVLPSDSGSDFDIYADTVAGQYVAIVFCPDGIAEATEQLAEFARQHESLRQNGILVVAVSKEPASVLAKRREQLTLPFHLLSDQENKLFVSYGVAADGGGQAVTLVVRPNQHVFSVIHDGLHAAEVLNRVSAQKDLQAEISFGFQPPILMVPDVLTADDCQWLIGAFTDEDLPVVSTREFVGMRARGEINGEIKVEASDYGRVDRTDMYIVSDRLRSRISQRFQTRLLPEIKKAFHYPVSRYEGLSISRYEGERGGEAHGHRDNSMPEVAERRFAVSINLNAEEFEGGGVRFTEFSKQVYRAPTGGALVFSCSLFHEAMAITKGHRFVLLTFLLGNQ